MLTIFHYDFMIRAFIAGVAIAFVAPVIGMFLVVKRYSTLADTLAHVSLLGIAAGAIIGVSPVTGALVASSLAAMGMERLRRSGQLFSESVLALFLSGSLALALILLGLSHGLNVNIFSYLFGSITTVSTADLKEIGLFGGLVLASSVVLFPRLFIISYDEDLAKANGLPVELLNLLLIVMAAVTVSISMRVVGILLVSALMVIPPLGATQFRCGFKKTALIAVLVSLLSVISGLFASFYLNLPSGGTIVLVALGIFLVSFVFNKKGF
ncbi:MAG: metal ABC transporter permease [Candidatus Sungbacteria bacterium]|uniref:Metal ABC transporter permease n=1 Tax=Candidatus Sungiibacteriota bacterium TaxID=2750080 RepID=A0A932QZN0_9BACT|nr:metal ABC transporter permease [Candidatus Sungbacteria bacterium]